MALQPLFQLDGAALPGLGPLGAAFLFPLTRLRFNPVRQGARS